MRGEPLKGDLAPYIAELAREQSRLEEAVADQGRLAQALHTEINDLGVRPTDAPLSSHPRADTLTRRRMLQLTGAGLGGGATLALVGPPGTAHAALEPVGSIVGPTVAAGGSGLGGVFLVPMPTGVASTDTANILQALHHATGGSTVVLQWSPTAAYSIDQELPVPRGVRLTGSGAASEVTGGGSTARLPTLQQAAGVNLACIVGSFSFLAGLYGPANPGKYPIFNSLYNNGTPLRAVDSGIEVDHLAFDGQNGGTGSGNTQGHGLVMFTYGAKAHHCYLLNIPNIGIWLADANYLGQGSTNENHENRIQDNTVINAGWYGIKVDNDYGGSGGATDGHILNNLIWSPSQQQRAAGPLVNPTTKLYYEGLRMENAAGWWIVNNHLIACPGNGAYFNTTGGLHLIDNTLDGFGCYPRPRGNYVGFNITTAGQTKLHPGRIIGNLAAAYESTNPFAPAMTATTSNTYEYFRLTMQTDPGRLVQPTYAAYPTHADNVAHQASQLPAPILGATISAGNPNKVTVPHGSTAGVTSGMVITDSIGLIQKGTMVKSVVPGTGTSPDSILLSAAATPGSGDTVSFPGPTSTAWTYANALAAADMIVHRSNEMATGTINPGPSIQITATPGKPLPTVTLLDPASFAGGEYMDPLAPPIAGDLVVASSVAGTATWQSVVPGGPLNLTASGALDGTFPGPGFSSDAVTVLTSSGSLPLPEWATRARVTCVGGGGGGGGGLGGANGQVGGSGGAAGSAAERIVDVTGRTSLTVTVGGGGAGGPGGPSGGSAGDGSAGGATSVGVPELMVQAGGGSGGLAAAPGSTAVAGAAYGASQGTTTQATVASGGGASGAPGGNPFAASPGGGGGGGAATATQGGAGGAAGTKVAGGGGGAKGGLSTTSGSVGETATARGASGGGGGAGAGQAGGSGGSGGSGFVIVQILG